MGFRKFGRENQVHSATLAIQPPEASAAEKVGAVMGGLALVALAGGVTYGLVKVAAATDELGYSDAELAAYAAGGGTPLSREDVKKHAPAVKTARTAKAVREDLDEVAAAKAAAEKEEKKK